MLTGKVIPVELIKIREEDGAQCYKDNDGDIHWLTGITRASDVKVGDKGELRYTSTKSWGLYFFCKNE